jgi:putative hydrolase of the HAD superfamily
MLLFMGFGTVAFPGPRAGLALLVTTIGPIIGGLLGMVIHDRLVRDTLTELMHAAMPRIRNPGDLAREPVVISRLPAGETWEEVGAAAGNGRGRGGAGEVDMITFDVGGGLYDDDAFAQAMLKAAKELSEGKVDEREFWELYDTQRSSGRLRRAVAERFVPGGDVQKFSETARKYWQYPEDSLYPDVRPALAVLATKYKLGLICDTQSNPLEALKRDGIAQYFSIIATPTEAHAEKPDLKIFRWALDNAGVPANRTVFVANRLDTDIRPAQQLGIRTIWLLRGEAPPAPTLQQLSEPDAVIVSLTGLPVALARVAHTEEGARVLAPERKLVPAH